MRAVLRGYFGQGNYGDDILFAVGYRLIKQALPNCEISFEGASGQIYEAPYWASFPLVASRCDPSESVIIYCGGTQFFAFKGGRLCELARQAALRSFGVMPTRLVHEFLARSSGEGRLITEGVCAAAVGIGLGPFALGAASEYNAAVRLAACGFIWVRDEESAAWCRKWRLPGTILTGADLSFLTELWCKTEWKDTVEERGTGGPARVGVIFREWKYSRTGQWLRGLKAAVEVLRGCGYEVQGISLCDASDRDLTEMVSSARVFDGVSVYSPHQHTLDDVLYWIRSCDVVVSARAHGVYVSAVCGVPCIAIEIEPKLRICRDVIGDGCLLWGGEFAPDELVRKVGWLLENRKVQQMKLFEAVGRLQKEARIAADVFSAWLGKKSSCPQLL